MMCKVGMAALAVAALAGFGPARADNIWDVENARANARAGGPTSAYDAELLGRWGCLSGTNSAFCRRIQHGAYSVYNDAPRQRPRRYE